VSDQQNWGEPPSEQQPMNIPPPPPPPPGQAAPEPPPWQAPAPPPPWQGQPPYYPPPGQPGYEPPPPPPGQPGYEPPPTAQFPPAAPPYPYPQQQGGPWPGGPAPAPRRSRRWWWIGGAVFLVVALIAAGVTIVALRGGSEGGADNPQAAVLGFFAAAEKNDAFAAADLLDPVEQAGVRRVLDNAHTTAESTGYQQGGGRNGLLDGVHISTDNVQTSVTNIGDDLARVTITGGQLTIGFDPNSANAGLRDLFVRKNEKERTWTAEDLNTESRSGKTLDPAVMTVRRSDKWYVSIVYSWVDTIARKSDTAPTSAASVDTETYGSPEDAAKAFADGVASMLSNADVTDLAKTLSPEEGTLVATYRKTLERDLNTRSVQVVGTPKFSADVKGDSATIKIDDLTYKSTNSSGTTRQVRFHDGCVTDDRSTDCVHGRRSFMSKGFLGSPLADGVVATRGAKGWHIDPVATYLDSLSEQFRTASKEDVAVMLAEQFGAPKALLRLDAQGELSMNSSKSVTLKKGGNGGVGYAVFDLPVKSGDSVTIEMDAPSASSDNNELMWFMAVGQSGRVARDFTWGSSYTARDSFTASTTETLKVVAWGPPDQSITIEARD
jgi:hypothetical protein